MSEDRGDALSRLIGQATTGMSAQQLAALGAQLSSLGAQQLVDAATLRRPSRRRPRRSDEVTYRVRIDLKDAKPPIWRRLDISSHLSLDEVHEIIQAAFEWTDSHLHRFALGTSVWDLDAENFLCPYDVEDGDTDGVPAHDVRLDEVLVDVGDRLLYVYDYGDSWEHVVRLEAVHDRTGDEPTATCVDGRRAGPPEDCGGIWGYSELVASGDVDVDDFDIEEINEFLATT